MKTQKKQAISSDRFLDIIKKAFLKAGHPGLFFFDRAGKAVNGQQVQRFLARTHQQYCAASPRGRAEVVRRNVQAWIQSSPPGLTRASLYGAYATQQEQLREDFAARREGIFVASLTPVMDPRTGEERTVAVWTDEIESLLPPADYVAFHGPRIPMRGFIFCPWDEVQKIVGSLMTPVGCYPERYRVQAFPTDEQLQEIKEAGNKSPFFPES